ncbi:MAG TPA: ADP-ribosylglycohydrolase family protein [Candidatus Gallacutalibacter pullistercoris]|nr:ADP-ribosylglycohydrolase family protein [Candidatus Gallacutalibacter pullistercoris]
MELLRKQIRDGILGLAVGDALGVPVEFRIRERLKQNPVTGMRAYGTHNQPAGSWSDDTTMALCTLESLAKGVDYDDMMDRFCRWVDEGYMTPHGKLFDIGRTTRHALWLYSSGIPALQCGGTDVRDNGNGSLMRILPAVFYLRREYGANCMEKPEAFTLIHNLSRLTHGHEISQIACGLYCDMANELMNGKTMAEAVGHSALIKERWYGKQEEFSSWLAKFDFINAEMLAALPEEAIKSSGYVVDTLQAALWCLLTTHSYHECVLKAVNLGSDTDTVAAVAGGLAGILYGAESIPEDWLRVLAKKEQIIRLCENFLSA